MFVWIASYPKSGNTLTRSMLSSYFFSPDGIFNFDLIKNIKQFPKTELFKQNGIDINNEKEVIQNYIKIQEKINEKNNIQFLKTHSYLFNIENNPFTSLDYSLGVIYIVRDPRNVVISSANHNSTTNETTASHVIDGGILRKKDEIIVYTGSWGSNYNSWKSFKSINKYLLIKYEDLINDREKYFFEILKFIHDLKKIDFSLDKQKFKNSIDSTSFDNMQKMEEKYGFEESMIDKVTGKKRKFFNLGAQTDWNKLLSEKLCKDIEDKFEAEMKKLNYL